MPDVKERDAEGWSVRYGCHTKSFGGHFTVDVSWSADRAKPGYVVRANGVTLKNLSPDVEDGKRRGVKVLRSMLEQALEDVRAEKLDSGGTAPGAV